MQELNLGPQVDRLPKAFSQFTGEINVPVDDNAYDECNNWSSEVKYYKVDLA